MRAYANDSDHGTHSMATTHFRSPAKLRAAVLIAVCVVLGGCRSLDSYVQVRSMARPASVDGETPAVVTAYRPSQYTQELLALTRQQWSARHCTEVLAAVAASPGPSAPRRLALAELNLLAARSRGCGVARHTALVAAARNAYELLAEPPLSHSPPESLLRGVYNRAVAEFVSDPAVARWILDDVEPLEPALQGAFGVHVDAETRAFVRQFTQLLDSERLEVTGFIERHRRSGLGASLVGVQAPAAAGLLEPNYFRRGATLPLTALLHFEGDAASLDVIPSADVAAVKIGPQLFALHADFTAPYAWTQSGSSWRRAGIASAFFPQRVAGKRGIYLLEPFTPNKIPILMIHGIAAGPQAWRNITNEILGTPDLHAYYQVWHYFYPTGQPYLLSAAQLRHDLESLRRRLKATVGPSAVAPLVVIGHSQGGMIARALVTQPGAALWNTVFNVGPESLKVEEAQRRQFTATLMYEPTPDIARVVFLETPHRGTIAHRRSVLIRVLDVFVDVPDDLSREFRRLHRANGAQLQPYAREIAAHGGPSPLESLSADSPLTQAFGSLPLPRGIHYHSIIAARDEYLTYESAHLSEADSELVLQATHQDTDSAATLAEIVRILRLDIAARRAEASDPAIASACERPLASASRTVCREMLQPNPNALREAAGPRYGADLAR
jgi:pimeloyl-ACP methyl ester carboxylesterase